MKLCGSKTLTTELFPKNIYEKFTAATTTLVTRLFFTNLTRKFLYLLLLPFRTEPTPKYYKAKFC